MIPFIKRRTVRPAYTLANNWLSALLLLLIFLVGLFLAADLGPTGLTTYLLLWIHSYILVYAGACRHCAYYGKRCPVPLEGGLVNKFFRQSNRKFSVNCLGWAGLAYVLRIIVPLGVILISQRYLAGSVFLAAFVGFWGVHLLFSGCPHCANTECLLNPDCKKG